MTFKTVTAKAALLQAQSSRILSTFTKTKNELLKLNETLVKGVQENEEQIVALRLENDQMNALAAQHANIISNITNFLNA
jgi:hypothetical protein